MDNEIVWLYDHKPQLHSREESVCSPLRMLSLQSSDPTDVSDTSSVSNILNMMQTVEPIYSSRRTGSSSTRAKRIRAKPAMAPLSHPRPRTGRPTTDREFRGMMQMGESLFYSAKAAPRATTTTASPAPTLGSDGLE